MKINSVHLQNSCCQWTPGGGGGGGASRRGFLYKKSESSRGFHKRWFLLQDNLLFYFSHKQRSDDPSTAATPVGLIVLEGCCVERLEGFHFQLTFPGSGERKYVLAAETEEEREDWLQAMVSAGYGFMQYAILEMEQAIDAFAMAVMNQQTNAKTSSSIPEDSRQKVMTGCGPVEVRGVQVTSVVEDASLASSAVNEMRNILEDQIPHNSRVIFERMHLQFREDIKRKTKEQYKQTYAQH